MKYLIIIFLFCRTLLAGDIPQRLENLQDRYEREKQALAIKYMEELESYRAEAVKFRKFAEVEAYTAEIEKTKEFLRASQRVIFDSVFGKWRWEDGQVCELKENMDFIDPNNAVYKNALVIQGKWISMDKEKNKFEILPDGQLRAWNQRTKRWEVLKKVVDSNKNP